MSKKCPLQTAVRAEGCRPRRKLELVRLADCFIALIPYVSDGKFACDLDCVSHSCNPTEDGATTWDLDFPLTFSYGQVLARRL